MRRLSIENFGCRNELGVRVASGWLERNGLKQIVDRLPQVRDGFENWAGASHEKSRNPLFKLRTVGERSFRSKFPRLWNDLRLSLHDVSQMRWEADPCFTFLVFLCSYLKTAYYVGLSSSSPATNCFFGAECRSSNAYRKLFRPYTL